MNTVKFNKGNTLVVAHRGVSGIEVENTCAAFIAAGNRSYYGIETDIYRTYDGKYVANHDGNLKRIAGENIKVEETTLSTLQSIVLFDKDGTKDRLDLRPCSLQNYISICKKYEKQCVLELKSSFTQEEIVEIIDIIKSYDYLDKVTFIAFEFENLVKVRNQLPNQQVQFLSKELSDEIIQKVIDYKMDVDIHYSSLTKEKISALHNAGLKANCWTVDTKEIAEQMVEMGVDYITTNILE